MTISTRPGISRGCGVGATVAEPKVLTQNQAITILRALGWRVLSVGEYHQALKHFQGGWALGPALKADGILGPYTSAALRISEARRRCALPTASAHFSFVEMRCKCGGKFSACARIWFTRAAFKELERYRASLGHGISIVSGCRCFGHNKAVHGASQSRHMAGDAADFAPERPVAWFNNRDLFHGRGWNHAPGTHPVRHGDMGARRQWMYG
jgi:zinc D-Ala-D-Ala carboxypeptidase